MRARRVDLTLGSQQVSFEPRDGVLEMLQVFRRGDSGCRAGNVSLRGSVQVQLQPQPLWPLG